MESRNSHMASQKTLKSKQSIGLSNLRSVEDKEEHDQHKNLDGIVLKNPLLI